MWSTGEGNGKPLQYSCLENPMNSMKRQNDRILKEELPRLVGAQYATGDQGRNNSRKNEGIEPKQKQYPVVDMCWGPAPVDTGNSKVGTALASLEKYINRYIERLETYSVVGKLVEKKRLNNLATWDSIHAPDGNSARKTGSKKERHGGISLSGN